MQVIVAVDVHVDQPSMCQVCNIFFMTKIKNPGKHCAYEYTWNVKAITQCRQETIHHLSNLTRTMEFYKKPQLKDQRLLSFSQCTERGQPSEEMVKHAPEPSHYASFNPFGA